VQDLNQHQQQPQINNSKPSREVIVPYFDRRKLSKNSLSRNSSNQGIYDLSASHFNNIQN